MARDDDKLLFSSAWDIDQLILSSENTLTLPQWSGVGDPTTDSKTINLGLGLAYPPVVDIMWRPRTTLDSTPRRWMQADSKVASSVWSLETGGGTPIFPGTRVTSGVNVYYQVNSDGTITLLANSWNDGSSVTVDIRYYIWGDRLNQ